MESISDIERVALEDIFGALSINHHSIFSTLLHSVQTLFRRLVA